MPYKATGKRVYVKKNGRWTLKKVLKSVKKAKAYAAALNIHVKHK